MHNSGKSKVRKVLDTYLTDTSDTSAMFEANACGGFIRNCYVVEAVSCHGQIQQPLWLRPCVETNSSCTITQHHWTDFSTQRYIVQ